MIIWTIVVFLLGLFGLLHEIWLTNYQIPMLAEATSVAVMLIALGMLYAQIGKKNKK